MSTEERLTQLEERVSQLERIVEALQDDVHPNHIFFNFQDDKTTERVIELMWKDEAKSIEYDISTGNRLMVRKKSASAFKALLDANQILYTESDT